jgi:hypothetical protein
MLRVSMALVATLGAVTAARAATVIPTVYEAGHFFATPTTRDGRQLRLLVDTGGGGVNYWITEDAAASLKLKPVVCEGHRFVEPPVYRSNASLPRPTAHCGAMFVLDGPEGEQVKGMDGMIGSSYLPQHTWTFDYPARTLSIEDSTWKPPASAHVTPLGLPPSDQKFPRISIIVDGESIDLLLDTGATAHPTAAGVAAMHPPLVDGTGTTSYITRTVMNGWQQRHPDWIVVEAADDLFGATHATRAIRVPAITVAGWTIGPVWFTERADANFEGMSDMMDGNVHGALGGNALDVFRMTIDYAHGKAYFGCDKGCVSSGSSTRPVTF